MRDDAQGQVANDGQNAAIVLSGNGCVVAGETLEEAAGLTFFLEDAARAGACRARGGRPRVYTDDEVKARAVKAGVVGCPEQMALSVL